MVSNYVSGSFLDIAKVMVVYCRYCTGRATKALLGHKGDHIETETGKCALEIKGFFCDTHYEEFKTMQAVDQRVGRIIRK